jgi:cell division protein FtsL
MIGVLFNHRTRGFRTINMLALLVLMGLALAVNLAKAYAGRDMREMVQTQRFIKEESTRIRLLKAEGAHLEQPERLQRLAKIHLNMAPLRADQEGDLDSLPMLVAGVSPPGPVKTPTGPAVSPIEIAGPGLVEPGQEISGRVEAGL